MRRICAIEQPAKSRADWVDTQDMANEHDLVTHAGFTRADLVSEPTAIGDEMAAFCAQRVEEARRQFQRVLVQWAQDVLVMRRAGRHRLRWEAVGERDELWAA